MSLIPEGIVVVTYFVACRLWIALFQRLKLAGIWPKQKNLASSQLTVKAAGQIAEISRIISEDPHLKLASYDGRDCGRDKN